MPRRRQNATTLSYRPQRPVWKISFVHAAEVSKGKKCLTCGWAFKLEPESQLKGLGWITTGFVSMCCGHQIASLLLYCFWLLGGQQVHMDGSKQTRPCCGILRLQYLIGHKEEVLTTNPTRATQPRTYNYKKAFHGMRSRAMVGMLLMSRTLFFFFFSVNEAPIHTKKQWHKYRRRHQKKNNVVDSFSYLTRSLSSH